MPLNLNDHTTSSSDTGVSYNCCRSTIVDRCLTVADKGFVAQNALSTAIIPSKILPHVWSTRLLEWKRFWASATRPVTRGVRWVRTNPPLSWECNLPEGFPLCCGELAAKYIVSARARAVRSVTCTLLYSDCTSLGTRPTYLVSYPDGLRISWGAVLVPYRPVCAVSKEQSGT